MFIIDDEEERRARVLAGEPDEDAGRLAHAMFNARMYLSGERKGMKFAFHIGFFAMSVAGIVLGGHQLAM